MQVFFIRANQNWGNHDYYPRVTGEEDASEVMQSFVGQFYADREPPRLLLLSHGLDDPEVVQEALSQKRRAPRRGRGAPARREGRAGRRRAAGTRARA